MSIGGTGEQPEVAAPETLRIEVEPPNDEEIFVLITQCLQNDFFLNLNCRLVLPEDAARKLLSHPITGQGFSEQKSRRLIDNETIANGPLGQLLRVTVGQRLGGGSRGGSRPSRGVLHLVNIRDWHITGDLYDRERRIYGTHCEAGTWGSDYLEGLMSLLDPVGTRRRVGDPLGKRSGFDPLGARRGSVIVHHVHSDTLFDLEGNASGSQSELEEVLRRIITPQTRGTVRVAVVGVYTDIKVQIVLQSLRVRFNPDRLVVSDSLTASPTLERHLGSLDFASKVLGVEVMHGVGDLARYLGSDPGEDEDLESSANEVVFADYAQYFRDKQSIVSYEDSQMRSYRQQITGRLNETVNVVKRTNEFLIACGILTLGATVVLAVIAAVHPGRLPVVLPATLLGLSVVQLVTVFFNRPVEELTRLLSREAVFRMLLESRSLRLALARYHLTTPQALRRDDDGKARSRADALRDELALLMELDRADFDRFDSFGPTRNSARNRRRERDTGQS